MTCCVIKCLCIRAIWFIWMYIIC